MEAGRTEAHHLAVVLNEAYSPSQPWSEQQVLTEMDSGATFMMGIYAEHPVAVLKMVPSGDQRVEFTDLGVLPIYRREGLARELMLEGINWCAIRSKTAITLDPGDRSELNSFFESLDFAAVDGRMTLRITS